MSPDMPAPSSDRSVNGGDTGTDSACDLTVVVPSFDECENIESTVDEIQRTFADAGLSPILLVVDDGSSDSTSDKLASLAEKYPIQFRSSRHNRNLGLGVALRTGFTAATTKWIGWLPADGQFAASDLLQLYRKSDGVIAVTGAVNLGVRRKADNIFRVVLSTGLRVVMRVLHPNIPSFNGILVFRRDAVDTSRLICRTGFVNMEILDRIRLRYCDGQIESDQVNIRPRLSGASKVANVRTVLIVVADLMLLRLDYWFRNPAKEAKTAELVDQGKAGSKNLGEA